MKFDKDYISLLAGLVDDDHIEEVRHKVHDIVQENDEKELKYVSEKVSLLEYVGFREEPYDGVSDLDREKATAARAQPRSTPQDGEEEEIPNTGDWKYYTPDHTVRKCIDMESGEYKEKSPVPATQKWKSNTLEFENKQIDFINKYSLEEECGDMGMSMGPDPRIQQLAAPEVMNHMSMATASIKVPPSLLAVMTTIQEPGPATNLVITVGSDGVPMSYIHKALGELSVDPNQREIHNELASLIGQQPLDHEPVELDMPNWSVPGV